MEFGTDLVSKASWALVGKYNYGLFVGMRLDSVNDILCQATAE